MYKRKVYFESRLDMFAFSKISIKYYLPNYVNYND